MAYNIIMIEIIKTDTFERWFTGLKDKVAMARIAARISRLSTGNLGDVKPVGESVSELRIDYGPGYRIYFIRRGPVVVVLLAGGDKRTQTADIKRAIAISKEWRD